MKLKNQDIKSVSALTKELENIYDCKRYFEGEDYFKINTRLYKEGQILYEIDNTFVDLRHLILG